MFMKWMMLFSEHSLKWQPCLLMRSFKAWSYPSLADRRWRFRQNKLINTKVGGMTSYEYECWLFQVECFLSQNRTGHAMVTLKSQISVAHKNQVIISLSRCVTCGYGKEEKRVFLIRITWRLRLAGALFCYSHPYLPWKEEEKEGSSQFLLQERTMATPN